MLDTDTYDWSQFEVTFYYNAHITKVFKYWTQAIGLESFFVQRCIFTDVAGNIREEADLPMSGDTYEWQYRHGFNLQGQILKVIDKEQFSFTFGEMQVDIYFRVLDTKTEVHLVQSGIPDNSAGRVMGHLNCRSCWVFFLTNLSSVLSNRKDLRDDNPDLVSSMEVGFIPLIQIN